MFRKRPQAALRIERKAFGAVEPTTYVIGTVDNIETLIREMEDDPQYFIEQHQEENNYYRGKVKFKIKRIMEDELLNDDGKEYPVLAVASYNFKYRTPLMARIPGALIFFLIIMGILMGIGYIRTLMTNKTHDLFIDTECTLFVKDGVPFAVDVQGERLEYDAYFNVNPLWDATALPEQRKMALRPIEAGCAVVHIP